MSVVLSDALRSVLESTGIVADEQGTMRYDAEREANAINFPQQQQEASWTDEGVALKQKIVSKHTKISRSDVYGQLRSLRLRGQSINAIDEAAQALVGLKELDVGANKIQRICNLPHCIKLLRASGNRISHLEAGDLPEGLLHGGLGYNHIGESLDVGIASIPSSIISLDLRFNSLCNLDASLSCFGLLPNLRLLHLEGNPFSLLKCYVQRVHSALPLLLMFDGVALDHNEAEGSQPNTTDNLEAEENEELEPKSNPDEVISLGIRVSSMSGIENQAASAPAPAASPNRKSKGSSKSSKKAAKLDDNAEQKIPFDSELVETYSYCVTVRLPTNGTSGELFQSDWAEWTNEEIPLGFEKVVDFLPTPEWRDFFYLLGFDFVVLEKVLRVFLVELSEEERSALKEELQSKAEAAANGSDPAPEIQEEDVARSKRVEEVRERILGVSHFPGRGLVCPSAKDEFRCKTVSLPLDVVPVPEKSTNGEWKPLSEWADPKKLRGENTESLAQLQLSLVYNDVLPPLK